jgi:hypothetical protein
MLPRVLRRIAQPLRFQQKASMGGHGKPYVLRPPNNPRAKNEWDLVAEEMPASKTDYYIAEFMGGCMWFWIMYSAYQDNGKAFVSCSPLLIFHLTLSQGLYQPWLESHDDHH